MDEVTAVSGESELPPPDRIARAWEVLAEVLDPEVPALSVRDLGIVRDVRLPADEPGGRRGDEPELEVILTPTYSGCPATEVIEQDVLAAIAAAGLGPARVRLQRAPAWTSDWISAQGRRKLWEYGIAPPGPVARAGAMAPLRFVPRSDRRADIDRRVGVACPRCASKDTERLAAFGATACKALYRCRACREPFEHFKPI